MIVDAKNEQNHCKSPKFEKENEMETKKDS